MASSVDLDNVRLSRNGIGVMITDATAAIADSAVSDNAGTGISLAFAARSTVVRSVFSNNGGNGLSAGYATDRAVYENNLFIGNAGHGLQIDYATSRVLNNTFLRNGRNGLDVFEGAGLMFASAYRVAGHGRQKRRGRHCYVHPRLGRFGPMCG